MEDTGSYRIPSVEHARVSDAMFQTNWIEYCERRRVSEKLNKRIHLVTRG